MIEDERALKELQKTSGQKAKPASKSEGQALARKINAVGYFETSALTGKGVQEAFQAAIDAANNPSDPVNPSPCDCLCTLQ